jgi:hypothetical protein
MKHICYLFSILYLLSACSDNQAVNPNDISMGDVAITLAGVVNSAEDFEVTLRNTQTNALFKGKTNGEGIAIFHVTPGLYEATASKQELAGNTYYIYNGTSGQIIVTKDGRTTVSLEMKRARTSQIVIKELYNGGCMKDDGVTFFQYDKCLILYNNTAQPAQLHNLCIGFCAPANAQATNHNYDSNGKLTYEAEGFIPVWNGV